MVMGYPGLRINVAGGGGSRAGRDPSAEPIGLPYAWPPGSGRVFTWVRCVVLLPIFVGIPYAFANYPVLHTEGRVVDGWVAAVFSVGLCNFMLIHESTVRADSVRLSICAMTRQHDYAWCDVAAVAHTETGLVVTDLHGQRKTIKLIDRTWQDKLVMRKSPMIKLAANLERIRLQVGAPTNLTPQVRMGTTRLTMANWTLAILVALGAVGVATLRTLGL
jgi:hypothetical protein